MTQSPPPPPSNPASPDAPQQQKPKPKPTLKQTLLSVLGAFVGIQSSQTRQRDFEHGHRWWVYVGLGILFATLLVLGMMALVRFILSLS